MNLCPDDIFWTAQPLNTKLCMVMQHHEPECLSKKWFAVFKVKVTVKDNKIKKWLSIFWNAGHSELGLMAHRHELDCLVKRLDCSVLVKVKVTRKVQNSSWCSSGRYLPKYWSFYIQTWYGDAWSWARLSRKKIGLLSSMSKSQLGLIQSKMTVSTISAELLIFLRPNLVGWYIVISWSVLCKKWMVVFKVIVTVKVQI